MPLIEFAFYSGILILAAMILLWLLSLILKNSSIVDIFWGLGFVLVFWSGIALNGINLSPRVILLGCLVTLWGVRLALYILYRNWDKPEDYRYSAWRVEAGVGWWWQSFFKVFLLQGVIMWIVAAPLLGALASTNDNLNWLDFVGAGLWLIGFIFEAGGDLQLARFKAKAANQGKLMTIGLWSLTRHPNYFGDAAQWWGFYIIALASSAWWTIFSPILMTFLLMRVSGVVMLEKAMRTKPGYETYMQNTPAFFPFIKG